MIFILVGSLAALSVGFLLIGLAAVKEAFWPVPYRRIELGNSAVEQRGVRRQAYEPNIR